MKKILFIIILSLAALIVNAQTQKYSKVKIYTNEDGIKKIGSLGIPLEGEVKKGVYIVLEISESDIKKLKDNDFSYDVLIPDVASYYIDRNKYTEEYPKQPKSVNCNSSGNTYQTPSHFVPGSMGGYYTYNEMLAQLDSMRAHYPTLISVKQQISTFSTIEGRHLYYVRISDNPDVDESEPEVLYCGLTHAREPMGMQQLIFFMWYLLENYNTNTEIHQLLDNTELYFVPIVNPDGYEYNHATDPYGGGMWRKNRRNNGGGIYGIDLNRNYGYKWGYDNIGSSNNPSDETYRGTAGFSEMETQAMKWFCEHRHFVLSIDYHCYGNILLYPWSYEYNLYTSDSLLYKAYSKLMTHENGYVYGTPNQTVGYVSNGASFDWYYGEQSTKNKIIGLSPEVGNGNDGFWPAAYRIEDIAKENIQQNLYIARFAGKYAVVTDKSPSIISQQNGYFKFDIQRLGLKDTTFVVSVQPLTSNIQSVGSPKTFSGMNILQTRTDSIFYTLIPAIQNGQIIKYLLKVYNGLYTSSDTIVKVYGQPIIVFNDNCTNSGNWIAGNWGICTSQYHSPSGSITDSPYGDYAYYENKSITLNNAINLTGAVAAKLNFWAKWNIEAGYDYVQVKASSNGGITWTPLCGKYTRSGTAYQVQDEPLYDGKQNTWVEEEIDLFDYIGQTIKLRFTLVSDDYTNYDGYYFDDITVTEITSYSGIITNDIPNNVFISDPIPNPAKNVTAIQYSLQGNTTDPVISLYNELGQIVLSKALSDAKGTVILNMDGLHKGIYYCRIVSQEIMSELKKIVVI